MKKNSRKASIALLIILCMGVVWGCGNVLQIQILTESEKVLTKTEWENKNSENNESAGDELVDDESEGNESADDELVDDESEGNGSEDKESEDKESEDKESENNSAENKSGNSFSEKVPEDVNKEFFYKKAESQGINRESAETYFQTLLDDDIFQDGTMELTGLIIEDMDGNGQPDMLVMVLDSEQKPFYGSGCLWSKRQTMRLGRLQIFCQT